MKLVEKFLFIHDSQLPKWGKTNAWTSLISGLVCIFVFFPFTLWFGLWGIDEASFLFERISSSLEEDLSTFLYDTVDLLRTTVIGMSLFILALGLVCIANHVLLKKVLKRMDQNA